MVGNTGIDANGDWLMYMRVTRAVLSNDGRRAIIYMEFVCGSLCGAGFLHELEREGDTWTLKKSRGLWTS
ncbi:MAG: hypothetical protein R3337_12705 [Gammaproteobacteria bacterium]|nr:hypothetical protein [Gammaproteobacteria bacterium]